MDIAQHKQEFDRIIEQYSLDEKADEVSEFLVGKSTTAKEFATLFAMKEKDAEIFLSFVHKGIRFKEKHLDK